MQHFCIQIEKILEMRYTVKWIFMRGGFYAEDISC